MLGAAVTIVLVYLAIGATLWALVLHPLDRGRDIPLSIVTWPLHVVRGIANWLREMRDIETMRRHSR